MKRFIFLGRCESRLGTELKITKIQSEGISQDEFFSFKTHVLCQSLSYSLCVDEYL